MVITLGSPLFVKTAVVARWENRGSFTLVGRDLGCEVWGVGMGEGLGRVGVLNVGIVDWLRLVLGLGLYL